MTEAEAHRFLAQFDKAREDFKTWPKWMQDAAVERAATLPKPPAAGVDACVAPSKLVYGSTDLTDGIAVAGLALTEGDKRLVALVMTALGVQHPAMDDLVALLMAARSRGVKVHAPDLLRRCLDTINALLGDTEGLGSKTQIDDDLLPDLQARQRELTAALGVKGADHHTKRTGGTDAL